MAQRAVAKSRGQDRSVAESWLLSMGLTQLIIKETIIISTIKHLN